MPGKLYSAAAEVTAAAAIGNALQWEQAELGALAKHVKQRARHHQHL
jgi:hypothetical protein